MSSQSPAAASTAPSQATAAGAKQLQARILQLQDEKDFKGLLKPEHCTLNVLGPIGVTEDGCQKYCQGVQNFWRILATSPKGSDEWQTTKNKLVELTGKMSRLLKAKADETKKTEQQSRQAAQNPNQAGMGNQSIKTDSPKLGQQPPFVIPLDKDMLDQAVHQQIDAEAQSARWTAPSGMKQQEAHDWLIQAPIKYKAALTRYRQSDAALKQMTAVEGQPNNRGNPEFEKVKADHFKALASAKSIFNVLRPQMLQTSQTIAALTASNNLNGRPASSTAAPPQTTPRQQPNQPVNYNANLGTSSLPNSQHYPQNPAQNQPQRPMNQQGQSNTPVALSHQEAVARSRNSQSNMATNGAGYTDQRQANLGDVDGKRGVGQPISKTWLPPPPQAVNMGASRPTLSGANNGPVGPMGQPAIQKPDNFLLQGPGDRVLEKKKLDELYRQVCGADAGEGDALNEEVSESMLQLGDEFIDNVITSACKLAKLRGGTMLEIRDIQLVLERQYNIRIPGFATDEVRTVRKTQPAAGYYQKMNAVQAAKVMGGKPDA